MPIDRQRFDDNGDPLVGGTLTIYLAGTTTPADIFLDAALTSSCTNPTSGADASDAAGWFPDIFAAEGTSVDVILKTSGGTTLETWDDLPFVGADTGDFSRVVSGNGRFEITGSGGAVRLRAGDPSPDNVGGAIVVEGWAGTQLDTAEIDAAETNFTGNMTVGSKKLPGVVEIEATTFTAVTSVDIPLTETRPGVRGWKVLIFDLITTSAGGTTPGLRLGYGGVIKSGASDYAYATDYHATTTPASASDDFHDRIAPTVLLGGVDSTKTSILDIVVITVDSGSGSTTVKGEAAFFEASSPPKMISANFAGAGIGGYGRASHLQLLAANPLSGSYRVEPIYGLGEA